jgi:periplasmic divalent cation tolerance protein
MVMSEFDGRLLICATTFPDRAEAERIVVQLLAAGLVVCGQIGGDMTSLYRWQGQQCRDTEVAVSLKIRDDRLQEALAQLQTVHPYDVPQLICWPATHVDAAYGKWAWEEGV